jgi:hypothetical protein
VRIIKRILVYLALALAVVLVSSTASVFIFKDRIIQQFIREANKSLNTPIKIGKIDISPFEDFPNTAIVFHDVYIEDSQPGSAPLLTAKTVSFFLNPIEVWRENYTVRGLSIHDSETHLKIDARGNNNYTIIKEGSGSGGTTLKFDLKNVKLTNTRVSYTDQPRNQEHIFASDRLTASIAVEDDQYEILAEGDVTTEKIGIGTNAYLAKKRFEVEADLLYDDLEKNLLINPSLLQLHQASFELKGTYAFKEKNLIDISCDGKNADIQTLLSLLPEKNVERFAKYGSDGDIYFNLLVKGEISNLSEPYITARFGCTNTTLFHPDYRSKIEHANMEGSFASASINDLSKAVLFLKNIRGDLNQRPFEADFSIQDFDNPYVSLIFKGDLEAESLLNFYPIPNVSDIRGDISINVSFEGKTLLLKRKATAQKVVTSGAIDLRNLEFVYGIQKVNFNNLNGSLQFNNNDLALSNVSGLFENSDFTLNGYFKNIITFLLFEGQPIGIETDLKSKFLDLDQLFAIGFGKEGSGDYQFSISPQLYLNFNCDVKAMNYRRFKPRKLKGNLLVKNQMAVARDVNFSAMGGDLELNGIVDAKNNKAIDVVSSFKLKGIHLDSAFYVFENFGQSFIEDKHLRGQAFAEVSLEMVLNEKLNLFPETLIADISTTIKNGELNNFEPLQKLNKYIDDEGLNKLRFADLNNDIHIEKKVIYLPQMEVESNVSNIQISGTHSFDQHIDYRVITPLRNKKKIDPDEAFGAVEDGGSGQAKLFLKIAGTTDDYKVSYDKEAVKKKIVSDLKKEVLELKEAFKLKGRERRKELELSNEEFEWPDTVKIQHN